MIVAGVMSGTSADGIDVAIVQVEGRPPSLRYRLLHLHSAPYQKALRHAVLEAMAAPQASVPDLARLNVRLSIAYADAVKAASAAAGIAKPDLIGCHGQTIFHQGRPAKYLGETLSTTWQLGDGSRIAQLVGAPVVSDFRSADMAAGGRGAPLVPFFDYLAFRHRKEQRIALNLGGIANMTILPPGASPGEVIAFDTGPGNMMIDAAVEHFSNGKQRFDRGGQLAAKGVVHPGLLATWMRHRFFRMPPPKSAGREEFGKDTTLALLKAARKIAERVSPEDLIATLTAFTAESVASSIERFAPPIPRNISGEVIAAGGGTRNPTLMNALASRLRPLGYSLTTTDALGLPSQAKEAVAFAVLAYETWHRRPSNLPSATGASRPVILGTVSYA